MVSRFSHDSITGSNANVGLASGGGTIPTVTNTAFDHGLLAFNGFGLSFVPTTAESDTNGEIIFGGVDTCFFTGAMSILSVSFARSLL